ncbi:DUF3194 domain-containing protein [Halovenus sp. WSH3]|uniref:DUF3194 domain-containing protein n=1 Tax=Halovenus carboxidivorans TaxID=2692199 RepID=A0A6B0TDS9_9EURY|nr:DUF3194 domain-containing protein [Halovenus carboxidivorans]MXR53090.1 DUF3194 domain-containing protein [Halovenus carboxidivorans]
MSPEGDRPEDGEIVQTAARAAEEVIFARYSRSAVRDFDVTVSFEDERLEVDVYLDAEDGQRDPEQVADDAVLAARNAVDELLA